MTGATVTSQAAVEALEAAGRRLAIPVFGRAYGEPGSRRSPWDPRVLYLGISLLLVLPVVWFGGRWVRRGWLLGQAAAGGLFLGVQFSTVQVLAMLRLEADWSVLAWTGLLSAGVFLASGLFGPVYCGYLCPTGAFLNLANRIAPLRRFLPRKQYADCDLGITGYRDGECIQCNRCRLGEGVLPAPRGQVVAVQALAVLLALSLTIAAVAPGTDGRDQGGGLARVEPLDVGVFRFKISAGALIDRPAAYWHVIRR